MATKVSPLGTLNRLAVDELRGMDLQTDEAVMAVTRSPHCKNLLRSTPGRVQKRPGFEQIASYDSAIHGCFELDGVEILHAGTALYADGVCLSGTVADARSTGKYFGGRLYILDGSEFWCLWKDENEAYQLHPVSENAYLPRIAAGKPPDGSGGVELEEVNLLSDAWTESFYGTAQGTVYQLEFGELDSSAVTVVKKTASGTGVVSVTLTEGTDFTVNRTLGTVTFTSAPGTAPVEGEDNVFITASKNRSVLRRRITQADVCTVYGESGSAARLFVTGCSEFKNRDFWSAANDPTYFSDLSYSVLGQDDQRILGYSLLGDSLAAHKNGEDGAVYVRTGTLEESTDAKGNTRSTLAFRTGHVITGYGAVAKGSFAVLGDEPLFLTAQGVFALTASDLTGVRYAQRRSYYADPALCAEENLQLAEAVVWKDFYLLALNNKIYCLDFLQKSYASAAPKSEYQYECYLLDQIPAVRLWVRGGRLFFGTADGRVCRFCTGQAPVDYQDRLTGAEPRAVQAVWETPDLSGEQFYRNKNFRWLAVRLQPAVATSVELQAQCEGVWQTLQIQPFQLRYFSFPGMVFSKLSFSGDQTGKTLGVKLRLPRVNKVRFRFENKELCEPFGLLGWALEFTQGRRYR